MSPRTVPILTLPGFYFRPWSLRDYSRVCTTLTRVGESIRSDTTFPLTEEEGRRRGQSQSGGLGSKPRGPVYPVPLGP